MKKIAFILIFAIPFFAISQIINIPADYATIQEGIDAAIDGDTVLVQPGTYLEHLSIEAKNITLASLFLTTGDTNYIASTIIDGDASGRVIFMQNLTFDARLTGFTLQNGFDTLEDGGGIYLNSATPIISDLIVYDNKARKGGGLNCTNGIIQLSNVRFMENESTAEGGAIKAFNSSVFMNDCEFSGNNAQMSGAMNVNFNFMGGEIYIVDISSCRIVNNISTTQVSGFTIMKSGGDAQVEVLLNNCEFMDNSCDVNGALVVMGDNVNFLIQNCKIVGNTATRFTGGAVFSQGCTGEVNNTLIASNIGAANGGNYNTGGITLWGGVEVALLNCTFADNEATYGGGITVGPGSEAYFGNCIFWGNAYEHIALIDYDGEGGTAYIDYCDIQYGTDSIRVDPFSMLNWGDHNIISDPMFLGSGDDAFSLAAGSPCIDTGTPDTTGMDLPPFDLLGNVRVWDGSGGGTAIIDMGSYEFGAPVWVGIEDMPPFIITEEISISIYPNPCRGKLNFLLNTEESQRLDVAIYNINGKLVRKIIENKNVTGMYETRIDLVDIPAGIYFLHVRTEEQISCKKLIVL